MPTDGKKMRYKIQKIVRYIITGCSIAFLGVLIACYIPKIRFYDNDLPNLKIFSVNEHSEEIILLPDEFQEKQIIYFWTNHQDVKVYLENQELYNTIAEEQILFGTVAPSRWNRIEIPENSDGKELRISGGINNFSHVREYVYGTDEEINKWLHLHYGSNQLVDTGIAWIGIIFVLFGISAKRKTRVSELPLYLGQVMVLVGMLLRVGFKGIPIHWMNEYTKDLIGYLTFFTATIPMYIYISKKEHVSRMFETICCSLAVIQLVTSTVLFLLHAVNICDVSQFLWWGALFWGIFILLSLCGAIRLFWRKRNSITVMTLFSAIFMALMIPLEILRILYWTDSIKAYGMISRVCFIVVIGLEVLSYAHSIQIMEVQKERTEEENKKLQLQLLSTQIRPHFILNTLGAIRSMIMEDAKRASDLLYDFSMYLRKNIEERDYTKPVPFGEELDYIETYLRLEQTRFGKRLKVKYHIEEREFWVLPLSIQPFVENAVKHGLFPKRGGGTLCISVTENQQKIVIEIRDDGIGFDASNLKAIIEKKHSVGLRSAIYRIETEMKGQCRIFSKESGIEGTLVRMTLPR